MTLLAPLCLSPSDRIELVVIAAPVVRKVVASVDVWHHLHAAHCPVHVVGVFTAKSTKQFVVDVHWMDKIANWPICFWNAHVQ